VGRSGLGGGKTRAAFGVGGLGGRWAVLIKAAMTSRQQPEADAAAVEGWKLVTISADAFWPPGAAAW